MAKSLNVLFISSEVEPFAKTGGLADVSGALPQTIRHLGHEIRIMMPRYGSIDERKGGLHIVARLNDIEVPVGTKTYTASVKSSFLPGPDTNKSGPPFFTRSLRSLEICAAGLGLLAVRFADQREREGKSRAHPLPATSTG